MFPGGASQQPLPIVLLVPALRHFRANVRTTVDAVSETCLRDWRHTEQHRLRASSHGPHCF